MEHTSFIVINNSSLCYVEYDFENDEQFCQKPTEELFDLGSLGYFDVVGEEDIDIVIVGSCNGLVCLTTKISNFLCGHVYVCNPIIRECVELPSLVPSNKDYKGAGYFSMYYGFGYLPLSNEYKVVRIISKSLNFKTIMNKRKVDVYTLGDGRGWRDGGEIDELFVPQCQSVLVDGELHWIEPRPHSITVFDLTDEKFYMLPAPHRLLSDGGPKKVVVLDGQLCIFQATTDGSWNIWLKKKMDDNSNFREQDGEDKIWRKESTMTMKKIGKYQPLTITKNGDILLFYEEKYNLERNSVVIRYDPKASTSKELGDLGLPLPGYGKPTLHVNNYISLRSLGEPTAVSRL
ncbi:F-box protein At3g07870-like [Papaver somniferum]|uniref:F-box protein At3g07870-like n=1 Tax=Papaver somniferum TaxID=3469 RepID=UPI000E6FF63A|nr:F-box protein At3g07870-like [Papaver somniferum]